MDHGYVTAVYHIRLPKTANVVKQAERLAVGQTTGTWTDVPGITKEFKDRYVGKIVDIYDVPPCELETEEENEYQDYLIHIAFPGVHSQGNITLLLTCLLGNDASTSAQVKLMDIVFPREYSEALTGPLWSIEELRKRCRAGKRPLLLNMIKPCTGITPDKGAEIFFQSACGGADIIKDDELLGNPAYSPIRDRVRAYKAASRAAYEKSGVQTLYFPNITDEPGKMEEHLKQAQEEGADGVMVNFAVAGYGALKELREKTELPILAHCAGIGTYGEGRSGGMASSLALGKLSRLCGADMVMMNTPYGGYPLTYTRYVQTYLNLTLPFYGIKPSIPVIGGGVHPQMAEYYIKELGTEIIIAAGGAVQGHPMGCAAGATAMKQAIECAAAGISLKERAQESQELSAALKKWGKN